MAFVPAIVRQALTDKVGLDVNLDTLYKYSLKFGAFYGFGEAGSLRVRF